MEKRPFLILGALNGFLAVACGAFGAHLLRDRISARLFDVFQTAVHYHALHALVLLAVGLYLFQHDSVWARRAGWLFGFGILLFCGSLYLLASGGARWLGMITPFGGSAFLAGWAALALAAWRDGR